jgi:hypothetical protein
MSRVWTTPVDEALVSNATSKVMLLVDSLAPEDAVLPWMDEDCGTRNFVDFWFAEPQKSDLRRIACVLSQLGAEGGSPEENLALDVLRIALSRLIITKDKGASLARDVSHSRPHKVAEKSDFAVLPMFKRSIGAVRRRLADAPSPGGAAIYLGDARSLAGLADGSIDAVLTSPPYLNAIDYMRGHRLSLVWLGHRLGNLRHTRSTSIGSERASEDADTHPDVVMIRGAVGQLNELPARFVRIVDRYIYDIRKMISEIVRVLRSGGRATFVVGNSFLRGVFVRNSAAVAAAGQLAGMTLVAESERPLPAHSRYLPMTSVPLGKRMRTETILSFLR